MMMTMMMMIWWWLYIYILYYNFDDCCHHIISEDSHDYGLGSHPHRKKTTLSRDWPPFFGPKSNPFFFQQKYHCHRSTDGSGTISFLEKQRIFLRASVPQTWHGGRVMSSTICRGFKTICFGLVYTPPKIMLPLKRDISKGKIVFQPAFSREYVGFPIRFCFEEL